VVDIFVDTGFLGLVVVAFSPYLFKIHLKDIVQINKIQKPYLFVWKGTDISLQIPGVHYTWQGLCYKRSMLKKMPAAADCDLGQGFTDFVLLTSL
jgi:hypothetical protein